MSADNGIYICHTLDGYRVLHTQGIENIFWNDEIEDYAEDVNLETLAYCFGGCEVYKTYEEAFEKADDIYIEIMGDDFCPMCEYGIQLLELNIDFPMHLYKGDSEDEQFYKYN